jgi:exo-beta-1,3-glucanase (GH17 family)
MNRLIATLLVLVGCVSGAQAAAFIGIDYGPFHVSGQHPSSPVPIQQLTSDLATLSTKFGYIKTYGVDSESNLDKIVPIAATSYPNLKIYQGVFENTSYNSSANTAYLDKAISLANQYPKTVAAVVVGNECLSTDSNPDPVTVQQLIKDLQYVRSRLKKGSKVKVTTGLGYAAANKYGQKLLPYVDSIMVNIYPFYAQVSINQAMSNLRSAYQGFKAKFPGKPVLIGETGWPSDGGANGAAVPSVANEKTYTQGVYRNASRLGSTFIFSAFDEPWLSVQNSWGPHWGLWNSDGTPKFTFTAGKGLRR